MPPQKSTTTTCSHRYPKRGWRELSRPVVLPLQLALTMSSWTSKGLVCVSMPMIAWAIDFAPRTTNVGDLTDVIKISMRIKSKVWLLIMDGIAILIQTIITRHIITINQQTITSLPLLRAPSHPTMSIHPMQCTTQTIWTKTFMPLTFQRLTSIRSTTTKRRSGNLTLISTVVIAWEEGSPIAHRATDSVPSMDLHRKIHTQ